MSNWIYYPITISLYSIEVLLSIVLDDIGPIFAWIALIANTLLQYYLPSTFLLVGFKLFASKEYQ